MRYKRGKLLNEMKTPKRIGAVSKSQNDVVRHARLTCLVSDDEMRIIDSYLRKYSIENKSRWMRETLLAFIHRNLESDYPTLFNEHDMRR